MDKVENKINLIKEHLLNKIYEVHCIKNEYELSKFTSTYKKDFFNLLKGIDEIEASTSCDLTKNTV